MAGLASVYQSLKSHVTGFPFVHIWNNQLQQLADGDTYAFPFPNCFFEIVPPTSLPIGQGYNVSDIVIRVHIGHEEYDAGGGNFEENTNVFAYRDSIIKQFTGFQPTACSSMMKIAEAQDFVHTNIYHYTVDFLCSFVDSKGSRDEQWVTATVDPPIGVEIIVDRVDSVTGEINEQYRKIEL